MVFYIFPGFSYGFLYFFRGFSSVVFTLLPWRCVFCFQALVSLVLRTSGDLYLMFSLTKINPFRDVFFFFFWGGASGRQIQVLSLGLSKRPACCEGFGLFGFLFLFV